MNTKELNLQEIRSTGGRLRALIQEREDDLLSQLENKSSGSAANAKFTVDSSVEVTCATFGSLHFKSPSTSRSHVAGKGVQKAVVDEASYIEIHLIDDDGGVYHEEDVAVRVELYNASERLECRGERVSEAGGVHRYRYVPLEPGCHQLRVTLSREPIRGSPYRVDVRMPVRTRFVPTTVLTDYYRPAGLACGPHGELAVVDNNGYDTLLLYNSQLECMIKCASRGSSGQQCYQPIGVAFDSEGSVLMVDGGNHRIQKFDRQGDHVKTVGSYGKEPLQFVRPTGIGVSRAGLVYVCDRTNHRVQILNHNLSFKKEFGGYGDAPGNLYNPWDVAFDSQGFVYIVDAGHRCIKKFTPNGEFRNEIGRDSKDDLILKCPLMLCFDEYDHLYVTDSEAHAVVVFDCYGDYCFSFGEYGKGKGQLIEPRGIAYSKDGALYVSDVGNKRIVKFQ